MPVCVNQNFNIHYLLIWTKLGDQFGLFFVLTTGEDGGWGQIEEGEMVARDSIEFNIYIIYKTKCDNINLKLKQPYNLPKKS